MAFGWRSFGIEKDELVLDIGSGDNPFFRADVVCDRYPVDNSQRAGLMNIQTYPHQKFVVGDAHSLPFMDKSFDFVVCSHLLEHLYDPACAIDEIVRVGRRGYIETPSALMESLYGWSFHKWLVQSQNDKLIFSCKSQNKTYGILPERIKKSRDFEKLVKRNLDLFLVRHKWQEKINYRVDSSAYIRHLPSEKSIELKEITDSTLTSRSRLKEIILRLLRLSWSKHRMNWMDILACPECKKEGKLQNNHDELICLRCQRIYRIWNGVPLFLH